MRGHGLGCLGAHLVRLAEELVRLALGVQPFPSPALLVGLALLQIAFPTHRVDIELGAVRVEVEHLVDASLQQPDVVGDHQQPPECPARKSRNHTIESASRWFVGSSSSKVRPENKIRASSTRRR